MANSEADSPSPCFTRYDRAREEAESEIVVSGGLLERDTLVHMDHLREEAGDAAAGVRFHDAAFLSSGNAVARLYSESAWNRLWLCPTNAGSLR